MRFYLLAGLVAAVVTFTLAFVIWKLSARYRLYPKIRDRDVHTTPTPRLGGVAMFIGLGVAMLFASQVSWFHLVFTDPGTVTAIFIAAFIIVVLGVLDDLLDLDWLVKLAGQLIAAGILVWQGVQLVTVPIGGVTVVPPVLGLTLTVLAVVLVMNAVNFIDGLDGLVAGVAIIANGVFFLYSYLLAQFVGETEYFNLASLLSAVLIGACVGFLPFNWHPAKLFMGDSGALLVGLIMATSAISVTGQIDPASMDSARALAPAFIPIVLPIAVLIVPLLDFGLAVTRRLRAGKSPFSADRKHLHHRLLDIGHSHLQTVLIFYAWSALFALSALALFFVPFWWGIAIFAIGAVACTWFTLAPLTRRKPVAVDTEAEEPS
ncbi:MAG: undecaprenyl/decaprenyl-phosphate alpha-N-acetylglucosaminyl 1-phosphate transferase [Cryobacterium sp.]|nr:undecaprenyl/decaprenyl-phosphate alpha-N-acetylglucosaminyl 1-phosphate transferase [Cryobacterium sp.]